jgi:frataxin-like iron-binding protein CyaY
MSNTFNAAKMLGAKDERFQRAYNYLIDLINKQLEILTADTDTGLTITDGVVSIDLSQFQPRDTTLTEIAAAAAPSLGYFLVSDGEDSWTVLSTTNVKSLLGVSTGSNGESNWRFV